MKISTDLRVQSSRTTDPVRYRLEVNLLDLRTFYEHATLRILHLS